MPWPGWPRWTNARCRRGRRRRDRAPAGRPSRRTHPRGRGRRPARRGVRARAGRDPVRPLLRDGDRRRPAGGARCRLADLGLGPERRAPRRDARRVGGRGGGRALAPRPARPPVGLGRRLRHRRHHGQLHLPGGRTRHGPASGGPRRHSRSDVAATRARPGRRRAASLGRPAAAVPRPRRSGRRTGGRAGADPCGRTRGCAGGRRRSDGRGPPGRQHPLRRLRPVRGDRGGGARARRVGPRRRRLRAVGGDVTPVARGARRTRRRRLLGDRRAQDPERAVRLRAGHRARRRRTGDLDGDAR